MEHTVKGSPAIVIIVIIVLGVIDAIERLIEAIV